ncbi:Ig-like domain-containing protein [Paraoerskovia marina]|uniref:DUF7927 domain-containing protein n=1 Tax=Paraoerskovia marina TaxID=545619 RepID=UPI0012DFE5D2|nr:Ig-like domain-containing protein [Paraoerskovia marina]
MTARTTHRLGFGWAAALTAGALIFGTAGAAVAAPSGVPAVAPAFATAAVPAPAPAAVLPAIAGNPGVPGDPVEVWAEDFENRLNPPQIERLGNYVGALGETYTSSIYWDNLGRCNGFVLDRTSPRNANSWCTADGGSGAQSNNRWQALTAIPDAIGQYFGQPASNTNTAVSSYTTNNIPSGSNGGVPNKLMFSTVDPITIPVPSRFITGSVTTAAECAANNPELFFTLTDSDSGASITTDSVNPCTDPDAEVIDGVRQNDLISPVNVLDTPAPAALLVTGSSVDLDLLNDTLSGIGNDAAYDNVRLVDVTPQLDKSFDPVLLPTGESSTMTFTITNTSELGDKQGWGFTDTLPDGLVLADPVNYTTDCEAAPVFAGEAGGNEVTLTDGGLAVDTVSCTVSMDVTSEVPATGDPNVAYANCPDTNVTDLVGLNSPNCADVEFFAPVPEPGLTIAKSGPADQVADPGDEVAYSITVENTGEVDYTDASPAVISDDLSEVLDDATFDVADVTVTPDVGTVDFSDPFLTWSGPIAVGDSVTIDYTVTVDDPTTGDGVMTNTVEGPPESNCDPDAVPQDPDCTTTTNIPGLTITKTSDGGEELTAGQTVTYEVAIENSGQVDYTAENPATFDDDLTDVLTNATYNDDAAIDPVGQGEVVYVEPELSWSGPLAVGETVTVTYSVVLDDPLADGAELVNVVTGPPESNCDPDAVPSDPDCAVTLPVPGLAIEKSVASADDPVVPGSVVEYTVEVQNTGTTDYTNTSPAYVDDDLTEVLDDATYNGDLEATLDGSPVGTTDDSALPTLSWLGPIPAGETVTITYSVTVDDPDEGDGELTNVVAGPPESNCPPDSEDPDCTTTTPVRLLTLQKTSDAGDAVLPGDEIAYEVTVQNTGTVPYTVDDPATVADDLTDVIDDATLDETSLAATSDGPNTPDAPVYSEPTIRWSGALDPGDTVTITYTVTVDDPPGDDADGVITNVIEGPPESNCVEGTDPGCTVTTPVRSVELSKTVDPADGVALGDDVTYTVTITNTGGAAYEDPDLLTVTDDLTDVVDDATLDEDSFTAESNLDGTPDLPTYTEPTLTWTGPLAVGETVTLTYTLTVNDPATGDGTMTNTVTGPPESNCEEDAEEPDVDCGTEVPTLEPALALSKSSSGGSSVVPGDTVTYTVTVENTGEVDYTLDDPATVSDDLTDVIDDATLDEESFTASSDGASTPDLPTYTEPTLSWSGALAIGETVTITYDVTVNDPATGDGSLVNVISGPPEANCVEGSEDPDCSVTTPVRGLEIVKQAVDASEVQVDPGESVTYEITITNTGGFVYTTEDPASFDDDLSEVLDDATLDEGSITTTSDGATTPPDATYSEPVLSWSGPLDLGETVTVTYVVDVNDPLSGDGFLANSVTGPEESTCTDPTDPGCFVVLPERQLDLTKTVDPDAPVVPGDVVTYTVTVENLSQVPYTDEYPATVADDLSGVLDDATYNDDAAADPESGEFTFTEPYLQWVGPIPGGESVTLTYSVTVDDPPGEGADGVLANVAFQTPTPPECPEGETCVPEPPVTPECGPDGIDPETGLPCGTTTTPVKGYSIAKVATTADGEDHVLPGGDVTYTVTVTNTGEAAYTEDDPAVVMDDLSGVLDDATVTGGPSVSPDQGVAEIDGDTLTWSGPLGLEESIVITYTVTVDDPPEGDGSLANVVTGLPESTCDPADGEDENCQTTTPVRALEIVKTSDAGEEAGPGQTVRYTVDVTNTGTFSYTDETPVVVTDDLTDVLDDATFNDDATAQVDGVDVGALAYAEPELTWTGPLAPGQVVTISYTVTVDDPPAGNGDLVNVVSGPPEASCGPDDLDCTTEVPVGDRGLTIDKSADVPDPASIGDVVTYTVVATNTGSSDYTDESPATVVDDLSGVLDDGTYNDDATVSPDAGDLAYVEPQIIWSGPIPAGESVTLTYTVTLTDGGDGSVDNVAFQPAGPGCTTVPDCGDLTPPAPGECTDGTDEDGWPCDEVSFPLAPPAAPAPPSPALPQTGAELAGLVALALGFLLAGGLMIAGVRRRSGFSR